MGSADMADLWRNAGASYRLGLTILMIGVIPFLLAGIEFGIIVNYHPHDNGRIWIVILVLVCVGVLLAAIGNGLRFKAMKRYRSTQPSH